MNVTNNKRGLTVKAGTAFLAATMVAPTVPVLPAMTAFASSDDVQVQSDLDPNTQVGLVLEGDDSVVALDRDSVVRKLLQDFAKKVMPDSASIANNCGVYLRYDDKSAPNVYARDVVKVNTSHVEDFCNNVRMLQKNSSTGWVQAAFTQYANGTGGVMNNTIFKVRYVERAGTYDYLEFNSVNVAPAKQVQITYDYNGGTNTADTEDDVHNIAYRYSDEHFDYADIKNTMEKDGKYFAGWYETEAAANTLDANHKVSLDSRFTEDTTLYAGWSDTAIPEYHNITYHLPNGKTKTVLGKHAGLYVTGNETDGYSAEQDLDLSDCIDPDTELFLGYYRSDAANAKTFAMNDEIPEGTDVYVRKANLLKLSVKDTTGKLIGSLNIAMDQPIGRFYESFPDYMTGKEFRLTSGKKISLGTMISAQDLSASDSETEVSCFEIASEKAVYRVQFDVNGGNMSDSVSRDVTDGEAIGVLPVPTMDRKVFDGWYTEASGGEKVSATTVVTHDMTLYAHWSDAKGTLSFNANGGTIRGNATVNVAYGGKIGNVFPDVVRDEYVFDGWFTEVSGGEEVTKDTAFDTDMVVYAHWTKASDPKTVTFDPGEGTMDAAKRSRTVEANARVGELPVPDRAGYDFVGWFTAEAGGDKISADTVVTGDVTYYAQWKIHTASNGVKTLTLNKTELEVDFGQELGLTYSYGPADADNAVFYWTSSNEDVIRVSDGEDSFIYVGPGTTVLTVHTVDGTKEASCTVKVNPVKRKVTSLSFDYPVQTVEKGGENNVNLGYHYAPVGADNATFVFRSSDPDIIAIEEDGSSWHYGTKYGKVTITIATVDGSMSATSEITVNEKDHTDPTPPETIYHTLSFDTAGGDAIESKRVKDGERTDLPTPVRSGYDFLGWYLNDGTKVENVTLTADLTVHARWKSNIPVPDMAMVRYDAQNGNPATSVQVEKGHVIGVLPSVSREGYRFLGWFTQSVGGSEVMSDTVVNGDMTVYAQWESEAVKKYSLRLNPNQGFINNSSDVVDVGTVLTANTSDGNSLTQYIPERPGYTFTGWFDNASGGHLVYGANGEAVDGLYWDAGKYVGGRDLQLFAQWARNTKTYKLRFDVRGGEAIADVTYDIGSVVTVFPTPVKEGHTFLGWYTEPTGGELVKEVTMNSDVRIFAQWSKDEDSDMQVRHVKELIQALDDEATLTTGCKAKIDAARKAYDALTDAQKDKLGEEEVAVLLAMEEAYQALVDALEQEDKDAAFEVDDLIARIGSVSYDKDCKARIDAAREAYEALSDHAKLLVSKMDVLSQAEARYAELAEAEDPKDDIIVVNNVRNLISGIPYPVRYTEACHTAIQKARKAYDALTDDQKAKLGSEYLATLEDREFDYENLEEENRSVLVSFDSRGGNPIPAMSVKKGTTIGDLPVLSRDNYEFLGWFTEAEGGEQVLSITADSNVTLYAHWEQKSVDPSVTYYKITLDPNYEGGAMNTIELEKGMTASLPEEKREGYVFDGWFTEAEGGERVVNPVVDGNMTLYAHWTPEAEDPTKPSEIASLFWMVRDEEGQTQNVSEVTVTTKDVSALNNLLFGWSPKDAAATDDFVISSSDTSVLSISNGNWVKVQKAGEANLIVTFKRDKTKTAVCKVIVKDAGDPDIGEPPVANRFEDLVHAIPDPVTLTEECKKAIDEARDAYDKLSDDEKAALDPSLVDRLTKAEEEYEKLSGSVTDEDREAAKSVEGLIDAIGKVEYTEECKAKIDSARKAYDELHDVAKSLVSNYQVLVDAESAYEALSKKPEANEVQKVYWTDRNDPDRKPVTDITISMSDISKLSDTIFSWSPGKAAKNEDFDITSSDPEIIRMKTERMVEILKPGKVDLTVTYRKDPTKNAVLHVLVTGTGDDTDDPNKPTVPIGPGDSSDPGANPNDPNGDGMTNSGGTDNPNGSGTTTPTTPGGSGTTDPDKQTGPYKFRVVFVDGTDRNITVQDPASSTVKDMINTLSQLNSRLTGVSRVTMKTAVRQEVTLDMTVPLTYVTTVAEDGDVLLIGYDSSNQPIGSAKITKTGDKAYTVKFSKDTNVELKSSKDASDSSGVSDKSKVANTGKTDTSATPVRTADSKTVPVYGTIAAVLAAMAGGLFFWRKRKNDKTSV